MTADNCAKASASLIQGKKSDQSKNLNDSLPKFCAIWSEAAWDGHWHGSETVVIHSVSTQAVNNAVLRACEARVAWFY